MSLSPRLRRLGAAALLACSAASTGCYKNTVVNDVVPPGPPEQDHAEHLTYFFWGLAGDHEIDTRATCPNDVRQVTYEADGLDVLVTTLTLGIVGLRTVDIQCAGPVPSRTASIRTPGDGGHQ